MIIDWKIWLTDAPPFVYIIFIISIIIGFLVGLSMFEKRKKGAVVCTVLFALALCAELICHFGLPTIWSNDGYDMARDMAFIAELILLPCAIGCLTGNILSLKVIKEEKY